MTTSTRESCHRALAKWVRRWYYFMRALPSNVMFGQTGRWAGKGSKSICSPRPKKHGGRPNWKPINAYCNVVQCHAMSMSHHRSHALWRHVARCGAMWRNVVQCGAMLRDVGFRWILTGFLLWLFKRESFSEISPKFLLNSCGTSFICFLLALYQGDEFSNFRKLVSQTFPFTPKWTKQFHRSLSIYVRNILRKYEKYDRLR